MGLVVTTQPASMPITLDEAKHHLRVEHDEDDAYITGLILAAAEFVQAATNRTLVETEFQFTTNYVSCSTYRYQLPRPPLLEVSAVEYLDADQTYQTLDESDWRQSEGVEPGFVVITTLPSSVYSYREDSIRITYTAGYAAESIPQMLIVALKMLVGDWYANRENVTEGTRGELPTGVQRLLSFMGVHQYR